MMLKLNDRDWKEFKFIEVFEIKKGFYNKKPNENANGTIPFIGATASNNGITQWNDLKTIEGTSKTGDGKNEEINRKIFNGNSIVVTNNGSVGHAYYQPSKFTCSHDINPLYLLNKRLNPYIAKFLIVCIEKQGICFMYSRKWRPERMVSSTLLLPINKNGNPDYDFMEQFIKEREEEKRNEYIEYAKKKLSEIKQTIRETNGGGVANKKYLEFAINEIFEECERGKRLIKNNHEEGNVPYVSSTSYNNGIESFIGNEKDVRKFNNCLSLANSGSVGSCFYEPFTFIASDHVTHLKNKKYNSYQYLFLATLLGRLKEKYNFNREISDKRICREKVLLPIEKKSIDYDYMENCIKNKLVNKYNEYINFSKR